MSTKQLLRSLKRLDYDEVDAIGEGSLEWLFENERLVPFLDWLDGSLHTAESLSKDEIQDYKTIEASDKVILEGDELRRAIAIMPVGQDENMNEEDLEVEIQQMKVKIGTASRDMKTCLEQRNYLNVLNNELSSKIGNMNTLTLEAKKGYKKNLEHAHSESVSLDIKFEELSQQVSHMITLHEENVNEDQSNTKSKQFPSQINSTRYFLEEENFTGALTSYTRRQFFDGIADMASAKDKSQYQLFEVGNPEFLLVRGEQDNVTADDCKELTRLQSSYVDNEGCYINAFCMLKRSEAILTKTESQLSTEVLQSSNVDIDKIRVELEDLQKYYELKTKELELLFDENVSSLLLELGELQAAKVLRGNYDLKIARQDYFTSRQDKVIKQLLLQNARYEYLTMLYELEGKANRDSYHLLSTAKKLLDTTHKSSESYLSLMESQQSAKKASRETIDSRDHLIHQLYSTFVDQSNEDDIRLYVTFSLLHGRCDKFNEQIHKQKMSFNNLTQDQENCMSQLELLVTECKSLMYGYSKGDQLITGPQQFSHLITKLEDVLATLEKSVKDVIKDVDKKKKSLASDTLKMLERTLFPCFFNDPTRLKKLIVNLKSRVDATVIQ